ncbi:GAF domain-containing protein [Stigmatella aurantiaca]|uniref:histidine kinase n=1 Tax=Stigmatella aurantiaca TaxID=41 RepID=A0A1H7HCQ3_STIAU|nr:CHASE3 domain-containing protein [Stigmatella aurantiaca]SEK46750.1 GAF domain-containing protein [Stigmatella aurantiaca]
MGIAFLCLHSTQRLSTSHGEVRHTLDVLASSEHLLSLLKDAETGQRGYLLVRDPLYLEPYQAATQAIGPALQRLRQLTSDNPRQQERLDRIEALTRQKLAELEGTLSLMRDGAPATAMELVHTGQGKRFMDSLRQLLHEVENEERQLLADRTERLEQVTQRNTAVVLGGIGLLGVLTLLAAGMTSRDFQALARAARERLKYEERLVALHAIDKAILRAASPLELIQPALSALRRMVGCERADLVLFEPGQAEARVLLCHEASDVLKEERISLSSPLATRALAGNGIQEVMRLSGAAGSTPSQPQLPEQESRYEVRLPLSPQHQRMGSLGLLSRHAHTFDERAVQVAREVADQVTIALEQARLRERLRGAAERLEQQVRERTAELNEANAELEAFSYSVSHDLRAPLRSIDGFSQAIEDDGGNVLSDRSKRFFQKVKAASGRMAELIDDLLNLSRLSRAEMIRVRVNLSPLAEGVIADLRAREPERQVEVSIQPELWAVGDLRLLRVALENLLGNAWKFSSKQPNSRIEVACSAQEGESVFVVRDNGAGFDMAYTQKLFSPFQRMHSEREFPGTGIGLATVHRIVRRHGGRIWAEGAVGKGATIFFTLGGAHGQ